MTGINDLKTIPGGFLFSLSVFPCKEKKCRIFAFRIHVMAYTDENTFKVETVCLIIDPTHSRHYTCFFLLIFGLLSSEIAHFKALIHQGDLEHLKRREFKSMKMITKHSLSGSSFKYMQFVLTTF